MNLLSHTAETVNEVAKATTQVTVMGLNSVNILNDLAKEASPAYKAMTEKTWKEAMSTAVAEANFKAIRDAWETSDKK